MRAAQRAAEPLLIDHEGAWLGRDAVASSRVDGQVVPVASRPRTMSSATPRWPGAAWTTRPPCGERSPRSARGARRSPRRPDGRAVERIRRAYQRASSSAAVATGRSRRDARRPSRSAGVAAGRPRAGRGPSPRRRRVPTAARARAQRRGRLPHRDEVEPEDAPVARLCVAAEDAPPGSWGSARRPSPPRQLSPTRTGPSRRRARRIRSSRRCIPSE